jgi:multidrug resistance efflux pump
VPDDPLISAPEFGLDAKQKAAQAWLDEQDEESDRQAAKAEADRRAAKRQALITIIAAVGGTIAAIASSIAAFMALRGN